MMPSTTSSKFAIIVVTISLARCRAIPPNRREEKDDIKFNIHCDKDLKLNLILSDLECFGASHSNAPAMI